MWNNWCFYLFCLLTERSAPLNNMFLLVDSGNIFDTFFLTELSGAFLLHPPLQSC